MRDSHHLISMVIHWLLLASLALSGVSAQAATFTVTSLDDSGPGSLRQAILDATANLNLVNDTITFQPGLTGTITLTGGEIAITDRITITGPGENVLTISGNKRSRIFNVSSPAATIQGLTIRDGNCYIGYSDSAGGGIYNVGTLTLSHITLLGNVCSTNTGNGGGAIYSSGPLTATYLTLANNNGSNGGGITNSNIMTIRNSTIADNHAGSGGGIANNDTLTVMNCTLSGNMGGGIDNGASATLIINDSTVSGNSVYGISNDDQGCGNSDGTLTISNSIIAGNGNDISGGGSCPGRTWSNFTSKGSNLFGANGTSSIPKTSLADTDIVLAGTIDTAIAPLADNGGPTMTQALVAGSPAINAGDNSLIPAGVTTDQRGEGFPRIVGTKVDIGAVEYTGNATSTLTITVTGNGSGVVTSNLGAINCGSTCSASFSSGASIKLTAIPDSGSTFAGFSGGADCTDGLLTMTGDKTCTATFTAVAGGGGSADCNDDTKINSLDVICVVNKILGL